MNSIEANGKSFFFLSDISSCEHIYGNCVLQMVKAVIFQVIHSVRVFSHSTQLLQFKSIKCSLNAICYSVWVDAKCAVQLVEHIIKYCEEVSHRVLANFQYFILTKLSNDYWTKNWSKIGYGYICFVSVVYSVLSYEWLKYAIVCAASI